jgi:hypothetical protein
MGAKRTSGRRAFYAGRHRAPVTVSTVSTVSSGQTAALACLGAAKWTEEQHWPAGPPMLA